MIQPINIFEPDETEFRRHLVSQLELLDTGHETNAQLVQNVTNITNTITATGLNSLFDVVLTNVQDEQYLQFNSATNKWQNADLDLSAYLRADGTVPLTANWDAGAYTITASEFAISTGSLKVSSTYLKLAGAAATNGIMLDPGSTSADVLIGSSASAVNYTLGFLGVLNNGYLTWIQASDYFNFHDDVLMDSSEKLKFRDNAIGIYSQADSYLDLFADGGIRIGDSSTGAPTNYIDIKPDGEINLVGNARVYKNEWVDIGAFRVPGTNPATQVDHGIADAWEFTDGTDDTIYAVVRAPQDMDRSVAPEFKLGWDSDTADPGDDSKQVVWQVEYLWRAQGEDMTVAAQETLSATASASTTTNGLVVTTITGVDLPSASDQLLLIRIKRLGADAADTLGDVAYLSGFGIKYTSNKLGVAY